MFFNKHFGLFGMFNLFYELFDPVTIMMKAICPAVQFGIATLELGGKSIGIIQGVTMDFAFDQANLFAGGSAYAVDVRPHTGTIQGNAEFADIDGQTIQKIIGGTLVDFSRKLPTMTLSPRKFERKPLIGELYRTPGS